MRLYPSMDFHLPLSSASLCVGFILRWVPTCGVRVVQLSGTMTAMTASPVLILIGQDSGVS